MHYEMEELVPIVGRLAQKYTANESTSVTYEKAEQLMGAVLYCIHEAELGEPQEHTFDWDEGSSRWDLAVSGKKLSAEQAYKMGAGCVEEKTRKALKLYHEILPEFSCYENTCLHDTFIKGLPEFFKWYDVVFCPQDTILTLDYPVLKDISRLSGIDRVYEFINCIRLEQIFLKKFPQDYVVEILEQYTRRVSRSMESGGTDGDWDGFYAYSRQEIMENLCEIVFTSVLMHILLRKPLFQQEFQEEERVHLQELFSRAEVPEIRDRLREAAEVLFQQYDQEAVQGQARMGGALSGYLADYLSGAIDGLAVRLKQLLFTPFG